jgi:UDP-N-acetylmuramoyl-L-alanyl-D-glutamate--2,6-diaminopimelate ligase
MSKPLSALVAEISTQRASEVPPIEVMGLTDDSRQVGPGSLFVAIPGQRVDGHEYLADAVAAGAVAAVGEKPADLAVPYFRVSDSRSALAQLAAAWQGYPARRLVMIGITGTDGKTTTANLLYRALTECGLATGLITTVNARIGDRVLDTGFHVTTPPAIQVQAYLGQMVAAGLTHCVMEVTSHGLAQWRVGACEFDIAVITNISHEHLDYHGSAAAYHQAKARLFRQAAGSRLKPDGPAKTAVLNRDDPSFEFLAGIPGLRPVSYGLHSRADFRATELAADWDGLRFRIEHDQVSHLVESGLLGAYNVSNLLAAFAAAAGGLSLAPETVIGGLSKLPAVPGRMEQIDAGQRFTAIVDFAHTPNALRQALKAARQLTDGRLIAVFGSAGLRDRQKRQLMAAASAELADITILTAEDPRTESLDAILEEMAGAAAAAGADEGSTLYRVPDRGQALRLAVKLAGGGDLVIACGKGHEQSMCFGTVEYPWDDRTALRAALAERLDQPGPAMPLLPTSPGQGTASG